MNPLQDHPILQLLGQTRYEQDWVLVQLTGAVCKEGDYGKFIKFTFLDENNEERTATCDFKYFDLLFPYIQRLSENQKLKEEETQVLVPVFLGNKKTWKFSNLGATVLLNEQESSIPKIKHSVVETPIQNYEFRYRSDTEVKAAFCKKAKKNGMSHKEFLAFIILRELEPTESQGNLLDF